MWKELKRVYKEINHFHSKCAKYILEKTMLKEELGKPSKHISWVTWDAATRVAQAWDQLSSAHGETLGLRSLVASKDAHWKIVAQSVGFQDELHWARKKISNLKQSSKDRSIAINPMVGGAPLAIIPISVRLPLTGSYLRSSNRPPVGIFKDESRKPITMPCRSDQLPWEWACHAPSVSIMTGSGAGSRCQLAMAHRYGRWSRSWSHHRSSHWSQLQSHHQSNHNPAQGSIIMWLVSRKHGEQGYRRIYIWSRPPGRVQLHDPDTGPLSEYQSLSITSLRHGHRQVHHRACGKSEPVSGGKVRCLSPRSITSVRGFHRELEIHKRSIAYC